MNVPRFDVFSGLLDKDALWIESVQGLGAAYERMTELAANRPGPYRKHYCSHSLETFAVPFHVECSKWRFRHSICLGYLVDA